MKRLISKWVIAVFLALFSTSAFAQYENLEPGLYYVGGEEPVQITHHKLHEVPLTDDIGIDLGWVNYRAINFKYVDNPTSPVKCKKAEFIVVIDPKLKGMTYNVFNKTYKPFYKKFTPKYTYIVKLETDGDVRKYMLNENEGGILGKFQVKPKKAIGFEWEKISDTVFAIHANLEPGEYTFFTGGNKLNKFFDEVVMDFTITGEE